MIQSGDHIGMVCCSNGQKHSARKTIQELENVLLRMGIHTSFSNAIYEKAPAVSASAGGRARALMNFYKNDEIKGIFDISGGDLANGILPDLFQLRYHFIQQKEMHGIVIGGNIRCFLKLAGTEYMPDFKGKILLLESYHGTAPQIETYLRQLQQLGAFQKAAGILLGTFTQMQAESCVPTVEMLVQEIAGRDLPLAVTPDIGHGTDSKGIIIGQERSFSSCRDTN